MKKSVNYILAGILAILGFSSCSALREARQARLEREQEAARAQQKALVDQILSEMEAQEAPFQASENDRIRLDSLRRAQEERTKLLYAVPNVPYREIKEMKK